MDFYNELSLMWGIICDVGVPPVEAGEGFPPGFQYLRSASTPTAAMLFKNNTNTSCSGPEYIDFVMSWVDKEISDGVLFPRNACKCNNVLCCSFLFHYPVHRSLYSS